MANKEKSIQIRLEEKLYEDLKKITKENDTVISKQVRYYIRKGVELDKQK